VLSVRLLSVGLWCISCILLYALQAPTTIGVEVEYKQTVVNI
jgi:hypothetical protein